MADGSFQLDKLAALAAPFRDDEISWRVGSTTKDKSKGMALAYIDARDVMERLDSVCGMGGWQAEYVPMSNGTTCCRIGVRAASGEWVWKSNGGSATGDVDKESEREMAEKGGYSDAFKRAAVLWGIGRYLYNIDSPWVELEAKGNSYVMRPSEKRKLIACHAAYVRNNFKPSNAVTPDAGEREQPVDQHTTGAENTPPSAPVNRPSPPPAQTSKVPGGMAAGKVGKEFEKNVANGSEPGLSISDRAKPLSPKEQADKAKFEKLKRSLDESDSVGALRAWLKDHTADCADLPEPYKSHIRAEVEQFFAHFQRLAEEAERAEREEYERFAAEQANREFAQ